MLVLALALLAASWASSAQTPPTYLVVMDRDSDWMRMTGLYLLVPTDVIQVWTADTGSSSYTVVLETEKSGRTTTQSVTITPVRPNPNPYTQIGCAFTFPDGVKGVTVRRLVVLELPSLSIRDEPITVR